MLRSRFAGTIVKAQQKALLDHVIFQKYVLNFVVFYLAMALQRTSLSLCTDAALADIYCFDALGEEYRPCKIAIGKGEAGKKAARR